MSTKGLIMNKHVRECIKLCESNGLTIKSVSKGKHLKIICEQGLIVLSSTPSDRKWRYSVLRSIRKLVVFH